MRDANYSMPGDPRRPLSVEIPEKYRRQIMASDDLVHRAACRIVELHLAVLKRRSRA